MSHVRSTDRIALTRRVALLGGTAALLAGPLGRRARAAAGTVVVSNWGGDWNQRTVRFVETPLVESQGLTVVRDLGMEPERKAKLLAERRLRRGSIDVIHLNDSDGFEMMKQDVLADLDRARIPNYADVIPALRKDYFVPWLYSGVVIIYNRDKIKDPPKSYEELWDKKWAGRLGLTNQLYFNYMMMSGLIRGGGMTNVEAGRERLVALKALIQPRLYAAHQQLAAGLATGEVDIALNYKARGLQWMNDGTPLAIQYPQEGAIAVTFGAGSPKRAPNPEAAYVYLNAMLDRKAMAELAAASFYAPANGAAALSPELRETIDFSPTERERLNFPDYAYVARNTAEWLEWWNKTMAR
ncbi:ABC transporter substrate-binding protein [Methylobacterium planeticum]|uniref:Extracellular solute-binding protein n=1 Tax=Methylobacterium planeticum TaxID=2615211 RepID=A0A6N6MWT4_9HYPH|nr:extracellular solute-binding protein [Methylobacterium planeticum]KAB1073499.1 extracellular solute-binding protein [Methylobacterium planeticum]